MMKEVQVVTNLSQSAWELPPLVLGKGGWLVTLAVDHLFFPV